MRFQSQPPRCVACNWVRCSGYISFGGKLHEPHCLACMSSWETLLSEKPARTVVGLREYRAWQAERAQKMGVSA